MTTTTTYRTLFQDYLCAGLQLVLAQVQAAEPLVPDELRRQAWHLLSYAFESAAAWPLARDLLLALAPKMEQAGFRDEWIAYLEQAVQSALLRGDERVAAECQLEIGYLYRLATNFASAREWLTASLENFERQEHRQGMARALNHLAYVAWREHHYDEAEDFADRALQLLDLDDVERAMSLSAKGLIAIDRREWRLAEENHRAALQIRQEYGDKRKAAWSLQNLGYAMRGQGKHAAAIACFVEALKSLERVGDPINQAIIELNLGISYYLNKEYGHALDCYARAEAHYGKSQDQLNIAKLHVNRGLCHLALNELEKAEIAFNNSITLFQQLGDLGERLNAMDGLGLTYLAMELREQAAAVFESALKELPLIQGTPIHDTLLEELSLHLNQAQPVREDLTLAVQNLGT